MLSPSIEVLIYLEHYGTVSAEELKSWRKSSLKGIIGKLEAQSLITRKKDAGKTLYRLSDEGLKYLDNYLDLLHDQKKTTNKWLIVLFSIPENNRSTRDKFRRFLQKNGFGNIFGAAWISPLKHGLAEKVYSQSNLFGISDKVIITDGGANPNDNRKIVNMAWNLDKISKEYSSFITRGTNKLSKLKGNSSETSYEAKKLIFELATIIEKDPYLPESLLPKKWPREQAIALYEDIRKKIN